MGRCSKSWTWHPPIDTHSSCISTVLEDRSSSAWLECEEAVADITYRHLCTVLTQKENGWELNLPQHTRQPLRAIRKIILAEMAHCWEHSKIQNDFRTADSSWRLISLISYIAAQNVSIQVTVQSFTLQDIYFSKKRQSWNPCVSLPGSSIMYIIQEC